MRRNRTLSLLLFLSLLALSPIGVAAQEPAKVALQSPATVPGAGETFTTDVTVSHAAELLGFQFDVNFDPTRLAVEKIDLGPFLASTGRSPQPLGPDTTNASSGRVVYGGFTLGTPEQPGASGDGVLATITWRVVQPGDFQASLSRVQLAGSGGRALPGSDTPAPPATAVAQAEDQATATVSPAQPSPAAAAPAAAASEPKEATGIPTWAIVALVVVVIVVIALLLARRRGSGSS